jgi:hypothetical protein
MSTLPAYFRITDGAGRDDFIIKLTSPTKIQSARDQLDNVVPKLHITGKIIKKSVDYNTTYDYHLDPNSIDFFEATAGDCDVTFGYGGNYGDEASGVVVPSGFLCPLNSLLVEEVVAAEEVAEVAAETEVAAEEVAEVAPEVVVEEEAPAAEEPTDAPATEESTEEKGEDA